jgi:hypothetical protein
VAGTAAVQTTLSASAGVDSVKILQVFDYLGFIDVEKPSFVDEIFQMFNSNFLSFVPNPLAKFEYDDKSYQKRGDEIPVDHLLRIISDTDFISERKCPQN